MAFLCAVMEIQVGFFSSVFYSSNEMYSKCYVSALGHRFMKLMFITPTFAGKAGIKVNVTL